MQTGQFFRLNRDTPAIDSSSGKPTAITVLAGEVICLTGMQNPENPKMIEARWQGCRLFLFTVDVEERGEKVTGAVAGLSAVKPVGPAGDPPH